MVRTIVMLLPFLRFKLTFDEKSFKDFTSHARSLSLHVWQQKWQGTVTDPVLACRALDAALLENAHTRVYDAQLAVGIRVDDASDTWCDEYHKRRLHLRSN
eukprot:scaffold162027_cov29-Tisochrysis_lutea.AAC.1